MREAPAFWGKMKLRSEDPDIDKVMLILFGTKYHLAVIEVILKFENFRSLSFCLCLED